MKFAIALMLSLAAFSAQAEVLPAVKNVQINVHLPHPLTAVQPTAYIKVTIASCSERKLEAVTKKNAAGVVQIKLVDTLEVNCMGAVQDFDYDVQISSDSTGERYVLLNPIAPNYIGGR